MFVQCQGEHQAAGQDHQGNIQAHQLARHAQRNNQRREPESDQDVEDIAADDAADGNVRGVIERGLQADRHLRRTAAQRNHGQADEQWANLQVGGDTHGAAHQQFGAGNQ